MLRLRLSAKAEADILHILNWTQEHHGDDMRERYERLLVAALRALLADPLCLGSAARPELGDEVRSYHLRNSRKKGSIARPRHLVLYRTVANTVEVGRVLHDAMELERHQAFDDPAELAEP